MKRYFLAGILALLSAFAILCTAVLAQGVPEFRLGFEALFDQMPCVVGTPLESEHWGANGDSVQQTTSGGIG